jgi:hypothetical protein
MSAELHRTWGQDMTGLKGILAGLLLLSAGAIAATVPVIDVVSWTPATTKTDGSAIPTGDTTGFNIRCGTGVVGTFTTLVTAPATATSVTITRTGTVGDHTWNCVVTQVVKPGFESLVSNETIPAGVTLLVGIPSNAPVQGVRVITLGQCIVVAGVDAPGSICAALVKP